MIFALPLAAIIATVAAADEGNQWATYPSVPKTATINGFADPVFDSLPECAQPCVKESVSSTPCPYWDTGCLCVMTTWSSKVTECYAENCSGADAQKAYDASVQVCKNAGVWEPYWIINDAASQAISSAAAKEATTEASSAPATSSTPAQQTTDETTTEGEATSATSAPARETGETTAEETTAEETAESTQAEASQPAASEPAASEPVASQPAASSAAAEPSVSSFEGAAQGVVPAAAVGVVAGIAMLL